MTPALNPYQFSLTGLVHCSSVNCPWNRRVPLPSVPVTLTVLPATRMLDPPYPAFDPPLTSVGVAPLDWKVVGAPD